MDALHLFIETILIIVIMADIVYHIHHHYGGEDKSVHEKLNFIINQNKLIMATKQEQYDALMARLDAVSNDIAADYKKLLDEVSAGTISQESLDRGAANVAKLELLGASVDNPVPETPPEEPTI